MNHISQYSNNSPGYHFINTSVERQESHAPFKIHTLEWLDQSSPLKNESANRLTSFEIVWIKKGEGSLKIDSAKHDISENTIYCLAPGQLRQLQSNNNLEGYYISFSEDFLYLAENSSVFSFWSPRYIGEQNSQIIKVDGELQNEIGQVVLKMMKEVSNYYILRSEILKGLLKIFIIYISRKIDLRNDDSVQDKDLEVVRKFVALLKQHFTTKKMVADYAKELYLTPNYLNQIVKKVSGFTASHHIQQHIILEAKRKAIYSDLSMKEVAYSLGFNDYVHFSRFFKTNSGMNFTCFKKSKVSLVV